MTQFMQVHPQNPQPRLIRAAAEIVQGGGLIAYPTDSYYALGFAMDGREAAARARRLRGVDDSHLFSLCCRDLTEIGDYGQMDTAAFRVIKKSIPGPYTFVLKATKKISRDLCHMRRKTIAFRVPAHPAAQALLAALDAPMITATLRLGDGEPLSPEDFREQLAGKVEAVVDAGACQMTPTTVIDFGETPPRLLRRGGGEVDEEDME